MTCWWMWGGTVIADITSVTSKLGMASGTKMDDAKVTTSDVTSDLSQHAYVLFYIQKSSLERDQLE